MKTIFSERTERCEYYNYGEHPRIRRRSGKEYWEDRRRKERK